MEENLRLVFIIISAIFIGAIFAHGFWTIRKQKNPYRLKTKKTELDHDEELARRNFDDKGFDQDGVGEVRVVGVNSINKSEPAFSSKATEELAIKQSAEFNADTLKHYINDPHLEEQTLPASGKIVQVEAEYAQKVAPQQDLAPQVEDVTTEQASACELSSTADPQVALADDYQQVESNVSQTDKPKAIVDVNQPAVTEPVFTEPKFTEPKYREPVYQEPVINAKPKVEPKFEPKTTAKPKRKLTKKIDKHQAKKDQLEMEFDLDMSAQKMPSISAKESTKPVADKPQLEPEVLIVSVVIPDGGHISGAALLPALLTLGMKFGDMDIFHRHQDNAGTGKVTFSLANMMNPGSFNLDEMETMTTPGVSLFMTLPNAGEPFEVFEQMYSAAKQLAVEFKAQVLDDKRSVMTGQTVQHYISRIREFERKNRIST